MRSRARWGSWMPGSLHHDLVGALAHQNGLGHPELVDAVAQDLQALGQGAFPELLDFIRREAQVEDQAPVLALGFPGRQVGELFLEEFLENRLFVFIGQGDGQRFFRHIPHFKGQAPLFRQLPSGRWHRGARHC